MADREFCICQNISHGHPPGECPYRATEADGLCKECHELSKKQEEQKRSSAAFSSPMQARRQPLSQPPRIRLCVTIFSWPLYQPLFSLRLHATCQVPESTVWYPPATCRKISDMPPCSLHTQCRSRLSSDKRTSFLGRSYYSAPLNCILGL